MQNKLLDRLVCPDDHSKLAFADSQLLARMNAAVARGRLKNRAGQTLDRPLEAALVRADAQLAYPVFDQIPRMLVDEAIPLVQLDG
jgi:uncharacterized protein YbaR (Trm112 family)